MLFITTSMSTVALLCRRRLCIQHRMTRIKCIHKNVSTWATKEKKKKREGFCIPAGYPHMHIEREKDSESFVIHKWQFLGIFSFFFFKKIKMKSIIASFFHDQKERRKICYERLWNDIIRRLFEQLCISTSGYFVMIVAWSVSSRRFVIFLLLCLDVITLYVPF